MLELRPGNSKALFRRGMACLNLSRLEEARELLTKAEKIDPKGLHALIVDNTCARILV